MPPRVVTLPPLELGEAHGLDVAGGELRGACGWAAQAVKEQVPDPSQLWQRR
jgi:hypothetical protein